MCLSIRCALALSVQLIWALVAGRAGEPATEARAQTQTKSTESAAAGAVSAARAHPAYQVFAAQLHLPTITALEGGTVSVGGQLKLDFGSADRMLAQDKVAVARLLEIPDAALTALARKLSAAGHVGRQEVARQFQTEVTDYKYLSERWERYDPGAGGESVKTEALKCLQAGDLDRAWQLFIELPRPRPPTGLRTTRPQQP